MGIWAEIKKSINSNLDKPLNITLDEIKTDVAKIDKIGKTSRVVAFAKGIPKNDIDDAQVLTLNDNPIISVKGSGRVLQIFPMANLSGSMERSGTVLFTVDDKIVHNNIAIYAFPYSDKLGYSILNQWHSTTNITINNDSFDTRGIFYFNLSQIIRSDASTFLSSTGGIVAPNGIPFKDKFELRLTQTMTTEVDKVGVLVVYELDE